MLSVRPSYNHNTGIFPVNTRTCSDLRCQKYFLSTVQDSFIDPCAGAMFKTLEVPKWHGSEYFKTWHDKKNGFLGDLEVIGNKWMHLLLLSMHDCAVMIHSTRVTVAFSFQ